MVAIAATGYGNLICDRTLAPSEIKLPLLQYPPGRYPPEDTTADSRENIEKDAYLHGPISHLLYRREMGPPQTTCNFTRRASS